MIEGRCFHIKRGAVYYCCPWPSRPCTSKASHHRPHGIVLFLPCEPTAWESQWRQGNPALRPPLPLSSLGGSFYLLSPERNERAVRSAGFHQESIEARARPLGAEQHSSLATPNPESAVPIIETAQQSSSSPLSPVASNRLPRTDISPRLTSKSHGGRTSMSTGTSVVTTLPGRRWCWAGRGRR